MAKRRAKPLDDLTDLERSLRFSVPEGSPDVALRACIQELEQFLQSDANESAIGQLDEADPRTRSLAYHAISSIAFGVPPKDDLMRTSASDTARKVLAQKCLADAKFLLAAFEKPDGCDVRKCIQAAIDFRGWMDELIAWDTGRSALWKGGVNARREGARTSNEAHAEERAKYQSKVDELVQSGMSYTKATEEAAKHFVVSGRTIRRHTKRDSA